MVVAACANGYHRVCPKIVSTPSKDLICSCQCHYEEKEEPMSDTVTRKPSTRWTPSEIDYLRANASKGAKALAADLGKPEQSIRAKAVSLGLSLRQPGSTRGRRSKAELKSIDSI